MPRYIDADSLKSSIKAFNGGKQDFFVSMIDNIPTADVQEVKHGKREDEIKNDSVHHPAHYTQGKIECIDFILDKKLDFSLGNAVKYIVRAGHKKSADKTDLEKQIEDLRKARQYLDFEIEHLEGKR